MPRNGSGTYSVPTSFITGTTISSDDVNDNFTDVGAELTASLCRDGQSTMTGQFKSANGSVSLPGICWASDTSTGLYRIGSGNVAFSSSGTKIGEWSSSGVTFGTNFSIGTTGTITNCGNITSGDGITTDDAKIELGGNRTGSGNAYLDLHATSGSDYELRLLRSSGTNGTATLSQTGTGTFTIQTAGAASLILGTAATTALTINSSQAVSLANALGVASGGSGRATATAYAVICGGTTSTGAHQSVASVGTSGYALISNGAGNLPTFQAVVPNQASTTYTTNADITTVIPYDDTIPQVGEGVEILSLTVSAAKSTSAMLLQFNGIGCVASGAAHVCAAMFIDGGSNAVSATVFRPDAINHQFPLVITHVYSPGDTSNHTISVRVGPGEAGTIRMNGDGANRVFGGVSECVLTARELF